MRPLKIKSYIYISSFQLIVILKHLKVKKASTKKVLNDINKQCQKQLEPILINYKRKKITIHESLISPPEKLHSAPLFSDEANIKSVADQ